MNLYQTRGQISYSTAALNWPTHRGTATAFPLAAFGLSAFFFSSIASLAFDSDPYGLLLLFTIGTFAIPFLGFFFLHVVPHSTAYLAVPTDDQANPASNPIRRTQSEESKYKTRRLSQDRGTQLIPFEATEGLPEDRVIHEPPKVPNRGSDETSSLLSNSSSAIDEGLHNGKDNHYDSPGLDLKGLAIIPTIEFWQLFSLLGILCGIGLMTIKYVWLYVLLRS